MKARWLAIMFAVTAAACSGKGAEDRAREAEEAIRKQMADPNAAAIDQQVSPETVKEVQQQLQTLREYMGEVNGTLDAVTINAIQAFQNSQGLKANGLLTDKTRRLLREAAERVQAGRGSGGSKAG